MKKAGLALDSIISYLLSGGVVLSLVLEILGMVTFYRAYGNLAITADESVFIRGRDFFSFVYGVIRGEQGGGNGLWLMTAGVVVLMLTPYLRVVLSAAYFAWEKDWKYVVITVFVLIVLTMSLILH